MAENVSQAFLSLSINCAKCHNHPLEKWTNDQYYGMANMFSRVRAKGWGGDYRGWNDNLRGYDSGSFKCKVEYGRVVDIDYSGIRGL